MRGWVSRATRNAAIGWLLLGGFFLLLGASSMEAAEKRPAGKVPSKAGPFRSEAPLTITGDRMEGSQKDRTIGFEGRVTVQQEDLTISGKRMKVFGAAADKAKPSQKDPGQESSAEMPMMGRIDRIEMEGGVRIAQREKVATAEKAVYYHGEKKIVLLGSPMVSQGADQIKGRMITLFLADGRSVVEGGESAPVQAILHPKTDKE